MKLVWGHHARRDLRELISYIAKDSIQNAELVSPRILDSAGRLLHSPFASRLGRIEGTRERILQRTPYLILYKVTPGQIRVLRILRGTRRWLEV